MASKRAAGYVYVLVSPPREYIKIGGTDSAPVKRLKEVNACEPYKGLGPWLLHDFRQVADWRKVEYSLHYTCRGKRVRSVAGQRELFSTSPVEASRHLAKIDETLVPRSTECFRTRSSPDFWASCFDSRGFSTGLICRGPGLSYWTEALIGLQERGRLSAFSPSHNWNAVAVLKQRIETGKPE